MAIDGKTKVCCIIGNPVEHSLSPAMHNAAYQELGVNFVYVVFKVEELAEAVKGIRALGIRGTSVTIPHKVKIIPLLDEVDKTAREIGAVNTVVNNNGKLAGYNTDSEGAIRALKEVTQLKEKKVVLFGAGGAARAIAFGLKNEGAQILILDRTVDRAQRLANTVGADYAGLDKLERIKSAEIIINSTSVGMTPQVGEAIVSKKHLHKGQNVFDIVYNPQETKLIYEAKQAGCEIVYGYKMLLYQAVRQFELFTGKSSPVEVMEKSLIEGLTLKR